MTLWISHICVYDSNAKLPQTTSEGFARTSVHCRLDPCSSQHGAYCDEDGVLHYLYMEAPAGMHVTQLACYQLHFNATPDDSFTAPQPVRKAWQTFQFVVGSPGDVMLVQGQSSRILYATLPTQQSAPSGVFLFGSHTGTWQKATCACYASHNATINVPLLKHCSSIWM